MDMQALTELKYESLYDEAREMALTLRAIDRELRDAATCEGDYPGGYPPKELLPNLCRIMYAHQQYWKSDRYTFVPDPCEVNKTESEKQGDGRK